MTYTDPLDQRIEWMGKAGAAEAEIKASELVYERVKTADIICKALNLTASAADITALALEIGRESAAQSGKTGA